MRVFAGTDGRVYFAAGEMIVSVTFDEAVRALRDLDRAINVARAVDGAIKNEAKDQPALPKEVTRELLR